jgi:hypothetical protein
MLLIFFSFVEKLEAGSGVTNFTNNSYWRRATGYPGPGIIPDTRTFYTTLEFIF